MIYIGTGYRIIKVNANLKLLEIISCFIEILFRVLVRLLKS